MGRKILHPTNHAIERFEQRILPHIPEYERTRFLGRGGIESCLYELARRAQLPESEDKIVKIPEFLTFYDSLPIPVTLVVDVVSRTIITLYVSSGWTLNQRNGGVSMYWGN